jgi:N-acetylmuramoyl-L-alanine amidase
VRIAIILFFATAMLAKLSIAVPQFAVKTVVIDAGHGGKDPGAIGLNKTREKDVALSVALNLGKKIKDNFPDVKIIYTRSTDVFIPLVERANIANRNKADLFISIHCNSSTNRTAFGSSTYVLGLHKTEDNLEVAKRENAVIELEDDVDKNYDFNPNTPEGHIIMSMKQNAFLDQSIDIAARIESELTGSKESHKSRGVKQAGFFVLYKTSMPSLLAEIGFISNPTEEMYLASKEGQDEIAEGIFNAFLGYKNTIEKAPKSSSAAVNNNAVPSKSESADNDVSVIANANTPPKKAVANDEETKPIAKSNNEVKTSPTNSAGKVNNANTETTANSNTIKPTTNAPSASNATAATNKEPAVNPSSIKPNNVETPALTASSTKANEYTFFLQLLASAKPLSAYPKLKELFGNIEVETLPNGVNRFLAGKFSSFEEAEKLQPKAAANGYPDAFVIAYKNGVRLDVNATRALKGR